MSYCRGEGDIYAYPTDWGYIVCVGCWIPAPRFRVEKEIIRFGFEGLLYAKNRPWARAIMGKARRAKRLPRLRGIFMPRPASYTRRSEFLAHLDLHEAMGDQFPEDVRWQIGREIEDQGDVVAKGVRFRIPFRAPRKTVKTRETLSPCGLDRGAVKLKRHI